MIRVIEGGSQHAKDQFAKERSMLKGDIKIAVFLNNENFLITDFHPNTPDVNLILEDTSHNQLHIEGGNCGYNGEGPNATVWILHEMGMDLNDAKQLVYSHEGLQFMLSTNGTIQKGTLNTKVLFSSKSSNDFGIIVKNPTVEINTKHRKILLFNPQYHCFDGLLNAIHSMGIEQFEYYIGNNSPLENYYRYRLDYPHQNLPLFQKNKHYNMNHLSHVNLFLHGTRFDIGCLIEPSCETQVIDTIYFYLTGDKLFDKMFYQQYYKAHSVISKLFHTSPAIELHDTITVGGMQ